MRHRKRKGKLKVSMAHHRAMRRNLVASLFQHGRITTTVAKAKAFQAMAEKLIALARSSSAARNIVAHTLPEPNASGRILTRVGMQWMGEVQHPEDGKVWRWEYRPGKDE